MNIQDNIVRIHVVAGVVLRRENKYLLVQEKLPTVYGLWNLPAGRVEIGMTLEETAIKEAKEETGFEVKLIRKLGVNQNSADEPPKHAFEAEIVGGELNYPKDEILDIQWFTLAEVEKMDEETKIRVPWVLEAIKEVENA